MLPSQSTQLDCRSTTRRGTRGSSGITRVASRIESVFDLVGEGVLGFWGLVVGERGKVREGALGFLMGYSREVMAREEEEEEEEEEEGAVDEGKDEIRNDSDENLDHGNNDIRNYNTTKSYNQTPSSTVTKLNPNQQSTTKPKPKPHFGYFTIFADPPPKPPLTTTQLRCFRRKQRRIHNQKRKKQQKQLAANAYRTARTNAIRERKLHPIRFVDEFLRDVPIDVGFDVVLSYFVWGLGIAGVYGGNGGGANGGDTDKKDRDEDGNSNSDNGKRIGGAKRNRLRFGRRKGKGANCGLEFQRNRGEGRR